MRGVSHCPSGETVPLGLVRGGVVRAGNASIGLAGAIPPDADGRMQACLWGCAIILAICFAITALLPSGATARRLPA